MLVYASIFWLSVVLVKEAAGKTTFADCGGSSKKITILGGSVNPDPILYPGSVSISAKVSVLEDLPPSGLKMTLKLTKLDPKVMPVPCLKNIGSCSYDVCEMIQNHKDKFCPMFPPGIECGCELKKSDYNLKNAEVDLPNFGEIFAKILEGHYNGTITFDDTNTKTEVGCIAVTFEIKPSE